MESDLAIRTHNARDRFLTCNMYTTGIVLVHGYLRIDADLVLPKVRAQIESECTLIAKGLVSVMEEKDN